jgi:hypothetical protein
MQASTSPGLFSTTPQTTTDYHLFSCDPYLSCPYILVLIRGVLLGVDSSRGPTKDNT